MTSIDFKLDSSDLKKTSKPILLADATKQDITSAADLLWGVFKALALVGVCILIFTFTIFTIAVADKMFWYFLISVASLIIIGIWTAAAIKYLNS